MKESEKSPAEREEPRNRTAQGAQGPRPDKTAGAQAAEQASRQASRRANRQATRTHASRQASRQAGKRAGRPGDSMVHIDEDTFTKFLEILVQ